MKTPRSTHTWLSPLYAFLDSLFSWLTGSPLLEIFYADALAAGNLAGNYSNGTAGAGATLTKASAGAFPSQDGIASKVGNLYLLAGQSSKAQNGLWKLTVLGSATVAWVLTRVSGLDVSADFRNGTLVAIALGGTSYGGKVYEYTGASSPTIGSDALAFALAGVVRTTGGTVTGTLNVHNGTLIIPCGTAGQAPTAEGALFFNTASKELEVGDGSQADEFAGPTGGTGPTGPTGGH